MLGWRGLKPTGNGRVRSAVNVRLAPPDAVADLPVEHFAGFEKWDEVPDAARPCVRDLWF